MAQEYSHSHSTGQKDFGRAFAIGIALNVTYIVIELIYGFVIDSLALIADAGHNMSDVLSLFLAWIAGYLVNKSATETHTYGYKKSTILAALLNALILLVAIGAIILEAVKRFGSEQSVDGQTIMIVAGIGVLINALTALLFFSGRKRDLNIKGAFLHMVADAGISLGVVIVGVILTYSQDLYWLDPVMSIVIAVVIFWGTWDLLKDSFNLALDAVPEHIDKNAIEDYLVSLPEVQSFHDLHIWAMSTTETALTVHIVPNDGVAKNALIKNICDVLQKKYFIQHTTIQMEYGKEECDQNQI